MSFIERATMRATANSSGEVSQLSSGPLTGLLHAIHYIREATASAFSTAAGLTITGEESGIVFLSMSPFNSTVDTTFMPRAPIHLSTAGSTAAGVERLPLANERLQVTMSSAGNAKAGTFRFYVG